MFIVRQKIPIRQESFLSRKKGRRLIRLEMAPHQQYDLSNLRLIHSVGRHLNPEAVVWGQKALGLPIYGNWWQTETGGIMIANFPAVDIRPGSMGRPGDLSRES
jgi:acetyl-CoA synthetase